MCLFDAYKHFSHAVREIILKRAKTWTFANSNAFLLPHRGSISAAYTRNWHSPHPTCRETRRRTWRSASAETPRGVTLTESGQTLAHHAQKILDEIALAEQDVRHFSGQPQGMVSIGLPSSLSMILSVPLAETVRHDFPNVTLRLVEAMSGDIQSWVADNSIDLGFLYDVQQLRHFNARPLFEEQLFLVSAPDNWAEPIDKSISLQSVGSLPLVLPSRKHGLREMIERFARAKNIAQCRAEIDALSQIKALVARASAYTILAHAAVLMRSSVATLSLFRSGTR